MPTHGHDYGVDASNQLNNLDWSAAGVGGWRPTNPVFGGRYFLNELAKRLWVPGEAAGAKAANPDLNYIFPLSEAARNRVTGGPKKKGRDKFPLRVHGWGESDATTTCDSIMRALRSNPEELLVSDNGKVIVYLDVEWDWHLSPNYWHGWASTIYWYCTGSLKYGFHPFLPGIYCATMNSAKPAGPSVHHRIPVGPGDRNGGDVQTGLTGEPNSFASRCWGVFASNPLDDTGYDPATMVNKYDVNFEPDWENRFDTWTQTVKVIFGWFDWHTKVPVRLWQYAPQPGGPVFDALDVDLDETAPHGTEIDPVDFMLKLKGP